MAYKVGAKAVSSGATAAATSINPVAGFVTSALDWLKGGAQNAVSNFSSAWLQNKLGVGQLQGDTARQATDAAYPGTNPWEQLSGGGAGHTSTPDPGQPGALALEKYKADLDAKTRLQTTQMQSQATVQAASTSPEHEMDRTRYINTAHNAQAQASLAASRHSNALADQINTLTPEQFNLLVQEVKQSTNRTKHIDDIHKREGTGNLFDQFGLKFREYSETGEIPSGVPSLLGLAVGGITLKSKAVADAVKWLTTRIGKLFGKKPKTPPTSSTNPSNPMGTPQTPTYDFPSSFKP